MEVLNTDENVSHAVIGGKEAQGFGIAATAEFVQMMSSSLYSNQKKAVVRETLCNAWDAHIASGRTDTPIKITLNDEWFIIEDIGYGIPHDKMNEIYCVYGASTKKKDSNQTGGFGLGCKSPFAYTDNFNVENRHGGIKTKNLMTRSSGEVGGMPGMTEILKLDIPVEETGIKVSIPMQMDDVREFHSLIKEIVFYGGIKATLNDKPLDMIDYDAAKNGFVICPTPSSNRNRIYVKYGNVIYPIPDHDEINHKTHSINGFLNSLDRRLDEEYCFIAIAEPNSINISPSREQLTLHGRTLGTLNTILDSFKTYTLDTEKKIRNITDHVLFMISKETFDGINSSTNIGSLVSTLVKRKKIMYKPNDLPWLIACTDNSNVFRNDRYARFYLQAYKKFVGKPHYLKMYEKFKKITTTSNFIKRIWKDDILKLFNKNGFRNAELYIEGHSIGESYYQSFARKTKGIRNNLHPDNEDFLDIVLRPFMIVTHAKNTIHDRIGFLRACQDHRTRVFWIVPKGKDELAKQDAQIERLKKLGWEVLDMRQKHPEEPAKEVKPKKESTVSVDDGLYTYASVFGKFHSDLGTSAWTVKSKTAKFVVLCHKSAPGLHTIATKEEFGRKNLIDCFGDDLVVAFTKRELQMYIKQTGATEITALLKNETSNYLSDKNSIVHRLISMDPQMKADPDSNYGSTLTCLLRLDYIWELMGMTKPTASDMALTALVTNLAAVEHNRRGMYDLMIRNIDPHPKLVLLESVLKNNALANLVDFDAIQNAIMTKTDTDPVKIQAMELLEHIFGELS